MHETLYYRFAGKTVGGNDSGNVQEDDDERFRCVCGNARTKAATIV